MKKILCSLGVSLLVFSSCSGVAKAKKAQADRSEFLKLKGLWKITKVDYDKSNYRVKPFDEGMDADCFVGSEWNLVPNNYSGTIATTASGNCTSINRKIKFEVVGGTEFKFKKIEEGTKAKQNISGYSLSIQNQTSDSFSLEQNVSGVKIVYHFQKI